MLDIFKPIARTFTLCIPEEHRRPVALIGAGGIVDYSHLPAYEKAGLEVVGIFDIDRDKAEDVAKRHGIETIYASQEDLLNDQRVQVVDIAFQPWVQPDIVSAALAAGKHLLCQKPLALDIETAERLVADAEARDLKLAVNQQLRFDEGIAVARAMVKAGWIGHPTAMSRTLPSDGWLPYPVTTRWLPDAIAGPMGSLLKAIAEDGTSATSGVDNLITIRLVQALYRSMDSGESQRLDDQKMEG